MSNENTQPYEEMIDVEDQAHNPETGTEIDDFTIGVVAKLALDRQQVQQDFDTYVPAVRHLSLGARLRLRRKK